MPGATRWDPSRRLSEWRGTKRAGQIQASPLAQQQAASLVRHLRFGR